MKLSAAVFLGVATYLSLLVTTAGAQVPPSVPQPPMRSFPKMLGTKPCELEAQMRCSKDSYALSEEVLNKSFACSPTPDGSGSRCTCSIKGSYKNGVMGCKTDPSADPLKFGRNGQRWASSSTMDIQYRCQFRPSDSKYHLFVEESSLYERKANQTTYRNDRYGTNPCIDVFYNKFYVKAQKVLCEDGVRPLWYTQETGGSIYFDPRKTDQFSGQPKYERKPHKWMQVNYSEDESGLPRNPCQNLSNPSKKERQGGEDSPATLEAEWMGEGWK